MNAPALSSDHAELVDHLRGLIQGTVDVRAGVLEAHTRDESSMTGLMPIAVVYPSNTGDVSAILRHCSQAGVPVVPFGGGTSLEGGALMSSPGICLDMTGMDQISGIDDREFLAVVGPGVHRVALNTTLGERGLFFSVDPGADATIGGMVGTGASGTTTPGYGSMRQNVLALECVLADGSVVRTGSRCRKSVAGLDLTSLLVGSEGTLAVITEITVRVHPIPERISAVVCSFDQVAGAVQAVVEMMQSGVAPARVELMDRAAVDAVNQYEQLGLPAKPMLALEFHGSAGAVAEQMTEVESIMVRNGATDFTASAGQAERDRLWRARHHAYFASLALRPGCRAISTDVCVPLGELEDSIGRADAWRSELPFPTTLVSHIADGNFHVLMMVDPDSPSELEQAHVFYDRLIEHALAAGGTSTGEHGIGIGKVAYLAAEHGAAVEVMRSVKAAFDPTGILNPGKVYGQAQVPA